MTALSIVVERHLSTEGESVRNRCETPIVNRPRGRAYLTIFVPVVVGRSRSGIGEARRALFKIGLQRLDPVRSADELSLLDGLRNEAGAGLACDDLVE
jgi:hypothetical protein